MGMHLVRLANGVSSNLFICLCEITHGIMNARMHGFDNRLHQRPAGLEHNVCIITIIIRRNDSGLNFGRGIHSRSRFSPTIQFYYLVDPVKMLQ